MNQYLKYQLLKQSFSGIKLFQFFFCIPIFFLLLTGCSTKIRLYGSPSATQYTKAVIKGYNANIRYWGDEKATINGADIQRLKANKKLFQEINILALSGGAEDGSYGAGFLNGWSKRGNRPQFTMVTGISTGALIAPFAFLGSQYDHILKRFYTQTSTKNILSYTIVGALFGGSAIADTAPLKYTIKKEINNNLVAKLAKEGEKGRVLLIGTTNIDAQRPVVWNITKIAMSGRKDAKKLIQDIILASASIPAVFPPVLIDVMIDGKHYQEAHVDGSVTRQIFVYSRTVNIYEYQNLLGLNPKKNLWLIRNTKIDPVYSPVTLSLKDIAERSISTLVKYQGRDNIYNIISIAQRDGFNVHITNVPKDFNVPLKEFFDPNYMQALYEVGYKKGVSESPWQKEIK
ncbi:MAG: patatin-like phospholipase family protein [Campylobacterales bacterium]|nr:patatin-like phospholipase family protein [Campylobacterales bacterium]